MQVVWFKRDLRIEDHAPLARAAAVGPVLCLYVYEPELLAHPTTDASHLAFVNASLRELDADLRALGGRLITLTGDLPEVFDRLHHQRPIARIWSHEETGLGITYARDKRVKHWCRTQGVDWVELPNHGVFRPHPVRDGWAKRWRARMSEPVTPAPERIVGVDSSVVDPSLTLGEDGILDPEQLGLGRSMRTDAQVGGIQAGRAVLDDFLAKRSRTYQGDISSPVSAWTGSSRLSPYLAWGNLSLRQVYQASALRAARLAEQRDPEARAWARNLESFLKRLHWQSHFIQKLEDQPDMEFRNLHRACDGLRDARPDEVLLNAWREGRTGYPLIDACMRALHATGWINFRMRAMLMSFSSYHLWQHWREPSHYLARLFLDFEPGIHYSQVQMQSGTTGINAVRIYSPVKQVLDQDPEGIFIRCWVPELEAVPNEFLARPETIPPLLQQAIGCRIGKDYPAPIVNNGKAYQRARWRMQQVRGSAAARAESQQIYARHGSRKRGEDARRRGARKPA